MANNQSQSQNSSKSQSSSGNSNASSSKPQTSGSQSASSSSTASTSSPSTSTSSLNASSNTNSGGGDMIEQYIAKGVTQLMHTLEPQLNRIGTQIVNRAMSRGQNIADTGVKRMQEQPWYMVGGALALVAVGVGLLVAFDANQSSSTPEFPSNVQ